MKLASRLRGIMHVGRHGVVRHLRLAMAFVAAILAAAIVTTLTIDLGPRVRARAER